VIKPTVESTAEMGTPIPLTCILEEQEIRGIIHKFPKGPITGYEWRLLVTYPATSTAGPQTEWTPWVFGSIQSVTKMLASWQDFLTTHGHLAQSAPPGSTAH
jgi:hypothetical protein